MFKKLMLAVATLIATMGFAFAQVDVNKADQAALDSVKGLGPAKTKAILDERNKNGEFKDWADLEKRVKGIGAKSAAKLSEAGLQVNGKALDGAAAKPAADKAAKADKAGKAEHKADAKAEAKADAKAEMKAEKADKAAKPADMKAADAGKSADAKKEPAKK
ncbi:helix-hairpin-helix domain-containing protein [Massilia sp. YIM B04103]|uniref:ComEA family DNA-binding protein n=1 Tax=Massilia sp. YIM B04103 TaxID=2963106 RepID=UPI0021092C1F|nr:helix-hairpin-helix domain-containing protein [Massilia sp. YIM B04103]